MVGLGVLFLIALGLIAAKGGKVPTMSPGDGTTPAGVPGAETMPLPLRKRIADALKLLTVGDNGLITGPVTAKAIQTATALAAELEKLGYKEAAAALRAYATAAAKLVPSPTSDKKVPLPPGIPAELADRLQRALQMERDPAKLEAIKKALLALPQTAETKRFIAILDKQILDLKIAQEKQAAAHEIQKIVSPAPSAPLPPPPPPAPTRMPVVHETVSSGGTYRVISGDTGEKIAQLFVGDKNRWRELLTVNPSLKDPKYGIRLYAGQTIKLPSSWPSVPPMSHVVSPPPPPGIDPMSLPTPTAPAPVSNGAARYTIIRGDTGEKIAFKFVGDKSRWRELLTVNPTLKDATYGIRLYEGKTINIPTALGWPASPGMVPPAASPLPAAPPPFTPPTASPAVPLSPVEAAAQDMVMNLRGVQANFGMPGAKGKEDATLVKRFQNLSGQSNPDGRAGPGTLASAAGYGQSDMPLVMYWPKSATSSKVQEYRNALNGFAGQADTAGDTLRAANLRASALREHGQAGIVGPQLP